MAQVKKFQPGGKTEKPQEEYKGKILFDGHEVDLEDYYNYASGLSGQDKSVAMDIYNSARAGNQVDYDSGSNTVSGVNWSDWNQAAVDSMKKGKGWTQRRANRQAFWGGKGDSLARALQTAGSYRQKEEQAEPTTPESIFKTGQEFDYNEITGEDGTKSWQYSDSLSNADAITYFNKIRDIVIGDDDLSSYNESDRAKLQAIRDRYTQDNDFFTNLESGIRSASKDAVLWDNLTYLGFTNPFAPKTTTIGTADTETSQNDPWAGYVNPFGDAVSTETLRNNDARIYRDENGILRFAGKENGLAQFLNDYGFLKGTEYEDGVMYNGALYSKAQIDDQTKSSSDLEHIRRLLNQRRAIYQNNPYADAVRIEGELDPTQRINFNGIGLQFGSAYRPQDAYINGWYEYFRDLNPNYEGSYNISDLSKRYTNLGAGSQVFAYMDPSKTMDSYARTPITYAHRDNTGKITTYGSEADLLSTLGLTANTNQYNSTNINYDAFDKNGFAPIKEFRTKSGNKNDTLFRGRDGSYRILRGTKYMIIKPNSELWNILISNKPGTITDEMLERDTEKKSDQYEKVNFKKNGGTLPKLQYGGGLHLSQTTVKDSGRKGNYDPTVNNPSTFKDGDLTSADKAELAAIAGDLVGFGASFAPVYGNIAGAGIGAASTFTQFGADIARDGLDWGDAGRLVAGLGMDALGLIPGAGTVAKAGKVVKTIKKSSGVIKKALKLAQLAGIGMAAPGIMATIDRIANGEDWNVDDVRNVSMALQLAIRGGIGGQNRFNKSKMASEVQIEKNKGKSANSSITSVSSTAGKNLPKKLDLTDSEIEKLQTISSSKNGDVEVGKFLRDKLNATGYKDTIDDADLGKLAADYGFIGTNKKWYKPGTWFTEDGAGTIKVKSPEAIAERGTLGNLIHFRATDKLLKDIPETYTPQSSAAQRAFNQMSVTNPKNFGNRFTDDNGNMLPLLPGGNYHLGTAKRIDMPSVTLNAYSSRILNPKNQGKSFNFIHNQQWSKQDILDYAKDKNVTAEDLSKILDAINKNKSYNRVRNSWLSALLNDAEISAKLKTDQSVWKQITDDAKSRGVKFAKGGKILKGDRGLNTGLMWQGSMKTPNDWLGPWWNNGAGNNETNSTQVRIPYDPTKTSVTTTPRANVPVSSVITNTTNNKNAFGRSTDILPKVNPTAIQKINQQVQNQSGINIGAFNAQNARLNQYKTAVADEVIDEPDVRSTLSQQDQKTYDQTIGKDLAKIRATSTTGRDGGGVGENKFENVDWGGVANLGMSIGRLFNSLSMNNAQHAAVDKGIKAGMQAMEQSPTEVYNRFQDNGISAAYNQLANQKRQVKGISSDYLTNFAIENTSKAEADNIALEGKLKLGEMFGQHQQQQNDLRRQYASMRSDIANRNNQRMAQLTMAKAQNEAQRIGNNYQSINNFGMELQQEFDQNRQRVKALDDRWTMMEFQNNMSPNKMSDSQMLDLKEQYKKLYPKSLLFAKKGGRIRNRLDPDEQIWVDSNKATAEAVKQIHKSIIELFMKATS